MQLKKNFVTIQDVVLLWEKLRPKQTSPEEKAQLVSQILAKVGAGRRNPASASQTRC